MLFSNSLYNIELENNRRQLFPVTETTAGLNHQPGVCGPETQMISTSFPQFVDCVFYRKIIILACLWFFMQAYSSENFIATFTFFPVFGIIKG